VNPGAMRTAVLLEGRLGGAGGVAIGRAFAQSFLEPAATVLGS
jgi:hypothetical protein